MHELAVSMMSKKTKKLYDKMQYGINQKNENVKRLEEKRRVAEKQQQPSSSNQNNENAKKKQRRG